VIAQQISCMIIEAVVHSISLPVVLTVSTYIALHNWWLEKNYRNLPYLYSMCPGSTQPLKMSTRIFLGVKAAGA
jgi:hypothetical protein